MNGESVLASKAAPTGLPRLRSAVLVAFMLGAATAGEVLRPTYRLAEHGPAIALEKQIPAAFGEWRLDPSVMPIVPDPGLEAMLNELYSQTLARTYINSHGQRVMLSVAYGSDQGNEATAVHRPEFCYSAQGFRVQFLTKEILAIEGIVVPVARLLAEMGQRNEPITYWVTLDQTATLPGIGRKLQQIRYGLKGEIPDGMLVRISNISSNPTEAFALQQRFLDQLYKAIPTEVRGHFFGTNVKN